MHANDGSETRDTLLLAGGIAVMVFGAGMLMASPMIRRAVLGSLQPMLSGQGNSGRPLGALQDVERYIKLKAM
jgi:hypothetical protein